MGTHGVGQSGKVRRCGGNTRSGLGWQSGDCGGYMKSGLGWQSGDRGGYMRTGPGWQSQETMEGT